MNKTSTEIELLKQADKNHKETHKTIMEQFKDFNKDNKKEHGQLFRAVGEIKSSIDTLPQKLDERYASKETEVTMNRIKWLVISAVVVALLASILK